MSSVNLKAHVTARIGALCYVAWGLFHVRVAYDIYQLGPPLTGIAQGRMEQLAAYMLTLSLFVIGVGVLLNWRNSRVGFWLNLCVAGWADGVWVLVVVLPGYVGLARGLIPPAIFIAGAVATATAQRMGRTYGRTNSPEFPSSTMRVASPPSHCSRIHEE